MTVSEATDRHMTDMLKAVSSQPGLHRRRSEFFLDTIAARCWISEEPFLSCALDLIEANPQLADDADPEELADVLIRTVEDCMQFFNWDPFWFPGQAVTLWECQLPDSLVRTRAKLIELGERRVRALYLTRLSNRFPAKNIITPEIVWMLPETPPAEVQAVLGISMKDVDFQRPPLLSTRYDVRKEAPSSFLGVVAAGWNDGLEGLRVAVGAFCLALELADASALTYGTGYAWVHQLTDVGRNARYLGVIAPSLVALPTPMPDAFSDRLLRVMRPRVTSDRDARYRTALAFLATGWTLDGTSAFANFFIGLDALFGEVGRVSRSIRDGVKTRLGDDAYDRVSVLIEIRHDIVHGESATVRLSGTYLRYFRQFRSDPTKDLFAILLQCLAREV